MIKHAASEKEQAEQVKLSPRKQTAWMAFACLADIILVAVLPSSAAAQRKAQKLKKAGEASAKDEIVRKMREKTSMKQALIQGSCSRHYRKCADVNVHVDVNDDADASEAETAEEHFGCFLQAQ